MSYFDNANTNVTRKSFGSKVDKTFQREGVVPLKDRKKNNGPDYIAEQAKQKELNKKVNDRRMNDYKESKLFNQVLQEGSAELKEFLMKDFMTEIVIESLLVDKNVVEKNLKNIAELVEEQLEKIGGFEGVKRISMETQNPLLHNIVKLCENTAKDVAARNLKDSKDKKADDLDLKMDKKEMEEFDYSKKSLGIETIIDVVKDKVFQVVQDEQKINNEKQEVIMELEEKVDELEEPVDIEEVMNFIFNKKTIEETSLFDSIMRKRYTQLLETNSSPIFENDEPDPEDPEEYYGMIANDEYLMDEIELVDDEEVEDYFLESFCKEAKNNIMSAYVNRDVEGVYSLLEAINGSLIEYIKDLKETNHKSKSRFNYCKNQIRTIQESLDDILMSKPVKIEKEYINQESTGLKMPSANSIRAMYESKMGKEPMQIDPDQNTEKEEKKLNKKIEEEVVVCPDCKKAECTCEGKDCEKMICEGFLSKWVDSLNAWTEKTNAKTRVRQNKNIARRNFNDVRKNLELMIYNVKDVDQIDMLEADLKVSLRRLDEVIKENPDKADKLNEHKKWLETTYRNMLKNKRKELSKKKVVESALNQLDDLCNDLDKYIDVHEMAYNSALESLYVDVKGNSILLPYMQPKDCGLTNIEFAYKTKLVCESLKEDLAHVKYEQDVDILLKAVQINLKAINESLSNISNNEKYDYKSKVLNMANRYIGKIEEVLVNGKELPDRVSESNLFNSVEEIEKVYTESTDYFDIESTNNELMETVLAETIVEYTIMEAFNTLNLVKYTKENVRQMARKNISK